MKNFPILFNIVFICFLLAQPVYATIPESKATSTPSAEFAPTRCMFEVPSNLTEGQDLNCGYLFVPENHAIPDGPKIQLAVAIIKSKFATPQVDPLFMEQGGPGGSSIDTFIQQLSYNDRLRSDRDIVLLEQRGTLNSIPNLMCSELDQLTLDTLEKDLSPEEYSRLSLQSTEQCYIRLLEQGVDLSAFDSLENAADLEDLRISLGYEKINLYGVSYGTLLALHYMKQYPKNLRSVILDGVLPPQTNFILQTTYTVDQALKKLFAACRENPACNREYPDLDSILFDLVKKLNNTPATILMTDPESGKTYHAIIDGDSFLNSIAQMLYATSIIPALPREIYDARGGNFDFFSRILSLIIFDRTLSYGMYYSVLCAEDADFSPEEQNLTAVDPVVKEIMQRGPSDFLDACRIWKVQPLDSSVDLPVSSDVPTLLLSGAFDPVTPSEYAQTAADTLSHRYTFIFPNGGHGQAFEGECQDQIILSFLENPAQAPDASCINEITGPDFYTTENVIDSPVIIKLLNLERNAVIQLFLLAISMALLSSAVLIVPLGSLIRRFSHAQRTSAASIQPEGVLSHQPLFLARISGWLAFLLGILSPGFFIGLFITIISMVNQNDNRLVYGLAGEARAWFFLPPMILLLSLGLIAGVFQSWINRIGSIWARLYYTFLSANALLFLLILGIWGMLFRFF